VGPSGTDAHAFACQARGFLVAGRDDLARAAYDELVGVLQRRASRLAFYYLRDAADADEAVQDAFVKAYMHLSSYDERVPFEAWFTRILVNGCLDRLKARKRRWQWMTALDGMPRESRPEPVAADPSAEASLVSQEWAHTVGAAIERLPDRQRTVLVLTHLDGRSTREISQITGLSENTVRVHLFRAVRKLRGWLGPAAPSARRAEA
jgi:RNA polymerase sigma-70 factor (ECF subfamily)